MNERDKLIEKLIKEKGGSRKDYLRLLDSIAYHESARTLDPTIKQIGGGPGRGKYQFEMGKHAGAITAAKRTKRYYKNNNIPVPQWLEKASAGDDLDVSTLTGNQQDILFLGNMREHPKADFSKVWNGQESVTDFWANYHWAGDIKDRKARVKSFNDSLTAFNNKEPKQQFKTQVAETQKPTNSYKKDLMAYITQEGIKLAKGGLLPKSVYQDQFNAFNEGGLHEENPIGGVPQGMGENGKLNTVEEGEASFNFEDGKYIFSNRLS